MSMSQPPESEYFALQGKRDIEDVVKDYSNKIFILPLVLC